MSIDWQKDIQEFHDVVIKDRMNDGKEYPHIPFDRRTQILKATLIVEEIEETIQAMANEDLCEIADGIADSIVVLLGTAIAYGIDIKPVWNEVHRTNMAKVGGKIRADGKRLKPEGWMPPDIKGIIEAQIESRK